MRKVSVDKAGMTVTAQGGCVARDVEQPCEAESLSVVFGAISETGDIQSLDTSLLASGADPCRYWWTYAWRWRGLADW